MLSILFAQEAEKHEGVADFRRRELKGRLMSREELDQWFVRQRAADGAPTEWLTHVPVPSHFRVIQERADGGFITTPPLKITKATAARGLRIERVEYAGHHASGRIATSAGGVLERLRQLSVELEEMFGWTQAEATTYVLTGEVPYVPPVKIIGPEKFASSLCGCPARMEGGLGPATRTRPSAKAGWGRGLPISSASARLIEEATADPRG